LLAPTSQMRTLRELEQPSVDEGFTSVEQVPFTRSPRSGEAGVFVAAGALRSAWEPEAVDAPHLVFDWAPGGGGVDDLAADVTALAARITGPVEAAVCTHPGGPPTCWCRPPLPGLPLAFARVHGVDPTRSTLVGTSPAHRTLAATLGSRYVNGTIES
jgi:hypothetical protein